MERFAFPVPQDTLARPIEAQGGQRIDLGIDFSDPCLECTETIERRDLACPQQFDDLAGGLLDQCVHVQTLHGRADLIPFAARWSTLLQSARISGKSFSGRPIMNAPATAKGLNQA